LIENWLRQDAVLSHGGPRCKFRYVTKFTAASRGFHIDSNAFELIYSSINRGKITVINISIYCL